MQTLGISEAPDRSEGRLKSLFWPSIQNATDVDYLGSQGFWICTVVAVLALGTVVARGQMFSALAAFLFYWVGGMGVRERSRYAASIVFVMWGLDVMLQPGILKVIVAGLLLSNLRATWIAARWKPESEEAVRPPRFADTWSDKLADQWPMIIWPKVRILYYLFSAGFLVMVVIGLAVLAGRAARVG